MDELTYLQEELEKDEALLKKYEEKLRYENDPREKMRWEANIKEIKQKIQQRKQEIELEKKRSSQKPTRI